MIHYIPYADMQEHIQTELSRLQHEMLQKRVEHLFEDVEILEKKIDRLHMELRLLKQKREDLD